jgi:thioredoxin reductase (NADPH)
VVVVGGGDSAFDWATTLAPAAASVTLVHRRAAFRAHAASVAEAERLGVRILTDATPVLGRRDQGLSTLEVAVRGRSASVVVPCQQIVAALGFTARLGPVLDWGLDVRDHRHVPVGTDMRTAVPGVYAAGDIATYPGKVPLIAVGFAEAATAVNNACVWIDPTAEVVPGHSTEQSILTGTRS